MNDRDKIRAYVRARLNDALDALEEFERTGAKEAAGQSRCTCGNFASILSFIDKLPEKPASEGLEEAADNALRSNIIPDLPAQAFRLGYRLGWEQCRERIMKIDFAIDERGWSMTQCPHADFLLRVGSQTCQQCRYWFGQNQTEHYIHCLCPEGERIKNLITES